ncbi:GTP-binding protein of the rab [Yamadazyma tenuis]|uniref:Ras-domain-containing protein n=1 Tax=Candida tenuis (strain ATCC 10573 / BCRC 21748 / CBS 615 / JCM 9827 / NBRC 10315 / NRRL Y-1498 / VKM Y-70) TaxID=590646 RepID=G3B837_CANTC|nr:ras-domain-containing protein [Yamadazyma tenuis ATCC 10573]XP_006689042.1 uncharacterized protein CANTEDRAFT_115806 [Yamadazyma tenuis ATCC 10573]EGV62871.1 ras-domain-containing protein [Yamadazyma tenuis ATCC 10573]EGV62872.1 hypothetical protein CANTEDRAFT_115806 [Yamadazyma tenuis ATCC 10573]WEJ93606.1 GTP-binding protein of the rab [Yamadazyma tenuis]
MADEEFPCPSYKVVVLGDSSVGKTSLVHRFTTDEFDTNLANTIGAAFITKLHASKTSSRNLKFEIWDTAGQERYKSLTPMYYRNSRVALVCYDLSNVDDSFVKSKYWIDQLKLNNESVSEGQINIVLVGTKSDLANKPHTTVISEFTEANPHVKHFITSAKTGEGIEAIFNSIIDNIPEDFFNAHYESLRQQAENNQKSQSISFLNNQFTGPNKSNCC